MSSEAEKESLICPYCNKELVDDENQLNECDHLYSVQYDFIDWVDDNDKTNKYGNNYLITGIVLACDGGISVSPNLRMVNYENTDKDSGVEYKVNFQFKF